MHLIILAVSSNLGFHDLPRHMAKLCELGLTLNKEPTSVAGFHLVHCLQHLVSFLLLSHRLNLILKMPQRYVFSQVDEQESLTPARCSLNSNYWTQLQAHKLEVSARSQPGKCSQDSCDNRHSNAMQYICLIGFKARLWQHTRSQSCVWQHVLPWLRLAHKLQH